MLEFELQAHDGKRLPISRARAAEIARILARKLPLPKKKVTATLAFLSLKTMQDLNHDFRGIKKPTNVLSFPQHSKSALKKAFAVRGPLYLGDILICMDYVKDEARRQKKPLNHHLTHMIVHGTLHLLGWDHIMTQGAKRMEALETSLLAALGVPDPYADK